MTEKKFFLVIFFNKFVRKITCNMRMSSSANSNYKLLEKSSKYMACTLYLKNLYKIL